MSPVPRKRQGDESRASQRPRRGISPRIRCNPPTRSPIGSVQAATPAPAQVPARSRFWHRAFDARTVTWISSLPRDAVKRGTGAAAMVLKRADLAGKTGSTNDHRDGWSTGYNDRLATSAWVGSTTSPMGRAERRPRIRRDDRAADLINFYASRSRGFPRSGPTGVVTARIDPETGQLVSAPRTQHARSIPCGRCRAPCEQPEHAFRRREEGAAGSLRHLLIPRLVSNSPARANRTDRARLSRNAISGNANKAEARARIAGSCASYHRIWWRPRARATEGRTASRYR